MLVRQPGTPRLPARPAVAGGRAGAYPFLMGELTLLSLYSGAGGFDLGFEQVGFRSLLAIERERWAAATHAEQLGGPVWRGDVEDWDPVTLSERPAVVIGGPPCQGFSVAGLQDTGDPRNQCVFDFQRVVLAARPRMFLMENVAALVESSRWRAVREALQSGYVSAGYRVRTEVLDAVGYGVAQRRRRVFWLGTLCPTLPLVFPLPQRGQRTVREALTGVPVGLRTGVRLVFAKRPVLRRDPFAALFFNGRARGLDFDRASWTVVASIDHLPYLDIRQRRGGTGEAWSVLYDRYLRRGGQSLHGRPVPLYVQRVFTTEAAALQGFPATFHFSGPVTAQYSQIGNAVPPPLARALAATIRALLVANP